MTDSHHAQQLLTKPYGALARISQIIAPLDVNGLIAADFIRDRDILVVSQRGTMFSEPALTCASIDEFNRELLSIRFYSEATKRAPPSRLKYRASVCSS